MSGGKIKNIDRLKRKGARPLTSADHRNSSQAAVGENWRKAPCGSQSIEGGYGQLPEILAAFPSKKGLHPSPDYFIPRFKGKVKKNGRSSSGVLTHSVVESKLRRSVPLAPSRC